MGFLVPPPPPTRDEINKRIANGARTLREIDPALAKWATTGIYKFFNWKKTEKILNSIISGEQNGKQ